MASWVPIEQQTVQWKIWNLLFKCRISNIQSMSTQYIKHHGMPSIGDPQYDKAMANELVFRMITIADMVKFYNDGVQIYISNPADTKIIYELISDHLIAWKTQLETSLNTGDAPVEDLLLMDKFANTVYAHAKYHFTTDFIDSILARRMAGAQRANRQTILTKQNAPAVVVNPETGEQEENKDKYPERHSFSDVFASRKKVAGGRKWK